MGQLSLLRQFAQVVEDSVDEVVALLILCWLASCFKAELVRDHFEQSLNGLQVACKNLIAYLPVLVLKDWSQANLVDKNLEQVF